ncbi:radical SAM protein [Pleurocapsa sp. CCALA 161]|uniref:spore photoproduct lyase family protein n=1 Tax=Pleurocapsa sp. CCALA 161 TaxID=2107688 RepID=UPI000D072BCB|nr:radical SAM protein [Pleurocapsa sp. CCALA 161]PSB09185.1 radical SAM protein [Pleurocapsa sp. CCALA 161]
MISSSIQPQVKTSQAKLWLPKQVLITPAAYAENWGQQILERVKSFNIPVTKLSQNRLTGLRGKNERETYGIAKNTLAIVNAPPSQLKLTPIPPSADWQFHLAQGCPAHCQYCYLAGSLSGAPVVKVYANLPQILANLSNYEQEDRDITYEVSCYTDPLGIEHLTGSLAESIRYFGTRKRAYLRWVSKFAYVEQLLDLPHNGNTHCRISVNADPVSHSMEGGTATVAQRLQALRQLAMHGYPVGIVIAPIMAIANWQQHYANLFQLITQTLDLDCDLTFELITHRFTPKSKEVLKTWYPNSKLDLEAENRSQKRNKFGGVKYVYPKDTMAELQEFIEAQINSNFPQAKILYWT